MSRKNLSLFQIKMTDELRSLSSQQLPRDEVIRHAFSLIRTCTAFNAASFFFFEPKTLKITGAVLENIDSKYLTPLLRSMREGNLTLQVPAKEPAKRGSDLFSQSFYTTTPLYQNVLQPNRLLFSLIGVVHSPDQEYLGQYWLWRSEGLSNFSKLDLALAEEISSILGSSLSHHETHKTDLTQSMIEIVKQRSRPGILIVDANETLVFLNPEAREMLELINDRANKDLIQGGALPQPFLQICRHFKEHLHQKEKDRNESPILSQVYSFGGEKFSIRGMILENQSRRTKPHFLILIERISKSKMNINRVLDQLHLSPREVAAVRLILLGQTNKEIAQNLGMSEHTVKDHIKNIMTKLRVTTRTGIISRIFHQMSSPDTSHH